MHSFILGNVSMFNEITTAYTVLCDNDTRVIYDKFCSSFSQYKDVKIESISLDDMTEAGEERFIYDCRCGGLFIITYDDMDDDVNVVQCNGCSLSVMVLYELEEESSAS